MGKPTMTFVDKYSPVIYTSTEVTGIAPDQAIALLNRQINAKGQATSVLVFLSLDTAEVYAQTVLELIKEAREGK